MSTKGTTERIIHIQNNNKITVDISSEGVFTFKIQPLDETHHHKKHSIDLKKSQENSQKKWSLGVKKFIEARKKKSKEKEEKQKSERRYYLSRPPRSG